MNLIRELSMLTTLQPMSAQDIECTLLTSCMQLRTSFGLSPGSLRSPLPPYSKDNAVRYLGIEQIVYGMCSSVIPVISETPS